MNVAENPDDRNTPRRDLLFHNQYPMQRQRDAWELQKLGFSYVDIAEMLGYASAATARQSVRNLLKRFDKQSTESAAVPTVNANPNTSQLKSIF